MWIYSTGILIILWFVIVLAFEIPSYLLPSPIMVLKSFIANWKYLIHHTFITLMESIIGFTLGSLAGLLIAIVIFTFKRTGKLIYPQVIGLQSFPKESLAPLLIVWLGFGLLPKVVMAALICFFPVTVNMIRGLQSVDQDVLNLMKSLSASNWQIFKKVRIKYSLPYLFSALKVGIGLALVGAIIGEFVGSSSGIGYVIMVANSQFAVDLLFASIIILAVSGLILYKVINVIESKVLYWLPTEDKGGIFR